MSAMQFTLTDGSSQVDQWEKKFPEIYRSYGDLTHAVCEKLQHLKSEPEMLKDVKINVQGLKSDPNAPDMVGSQCPDDFPKDEENTYNFKFADGSSYKLVCKKI